MLPNLAVVENFSHYSR